MAESVVWMGRDFKDSLTGQVI